MSGSLEGRKLTEAYRIAQARVSARAATQLLAAWRILDPEQLDATLVAWLSVAVPLIQTHRRASAALASNYLTAFRVAELGIEVAPFAPIVAGPVPAEAVVTSLTVTGPVRIKQAMSSGGQLAKAVSTAETTSTKAGLRHVLDGGRDTVTATTKADRKALGWARATSGSPCAFCALVASRGPVYKAQSSASFEPHDGCHCTPEPVYHRDADWPPGSRRYAEIYRDVAKGLPADEARAAFRAAVEAV